MPIISGRLIFDKARTAQATASMPGIENVPIVLQNLNTGATLGILTNENGNYTFNNVDNGDYQIVEYYGFQGATPTPGDFAFAVTMPLLTGGKVPPISYTPTAPQDATHLDCTTKNTKLVTVSGANLTSNNFLNGPVRYIPITQTMSDDVEILPDNLITGVDFGTFGKFGAGTNANTGANPNPYQFVTDFTYVLPEFETVCPADGEYTLQNTMNNSHSNQVGTWWVVSDHTEGNETGRMMVVNGHHPGDIIYSETVEVRPNTYYLFSAWILNLCKKTGYVNPKFGVTITNELEDILYDEALGSLIPINTINPEWKQIGTVLYSADSNYLTIEFKSLGSAATGNDYAIDDISLNEVIIPVYTPVKEADKTEIRLFEKVTYTVTLHNPSTEPLTQVFFQDVLPAGLKFVEGSVFVNGINEPDLDPNTGFFVPDILSGNSLVVTFCAMVDELFECSVFVNKAYMVYHYSPVEGGIPECYEVESNEVVVEVLYNYADVGITKRVLEDIVRAGNTITYHLQVINYGPTIAENVRIEDILSDKLIWGFYSIDDQVNWDEWNGSLELGDLAVNEIRDIYIKATVYILAVGDIYNTAIVSTTSIDPNLDNNISRITTTIVTPMDDPMCDLAIVKTVYPNPCMAGEQVIYGITIENYGPYDGYDVLLMDEMPPSVTNAEYSLNDEWLPWEGSLLIPFLQQGGTVTILIRATIDENATGIVSNTAVVSSLLIDPDFSDNVAEAHTEVISSADISITKSANVNTIRIGEKLRYTLTITNSGPSVSQNIIISDVLPYGLVNPRYSLDGIRWETWEGFYTLDQLGKNATFELYIEAIVSSNIADTAENTAKVSSSTPDPNMENNEATVLIDIEKIADLAITKTALSTSISPGDTIIYAIKATNFGPADATNVLITDILPDNLDNEEYSLDGGITWHRWYDTYRIDRLNCDAEFSLLIRAVVSLESSGVIHNTVNVQSDIYDDDESNNTATEETEVIQKKKGADLFVYKSVCPNTPCPGKEIFYTIIVSNLGVEDAHDVILTDIVSNKINAVKYSRDEGINWYDYNGTLELGTIEAGAQVIVLIKGVVKRCVRGLIVNKASVTTSTPETDYTNNEYTVTSIIGNCCPHK